MELLIHGYELTVRLADAENLEIEPVEKPEEVNKSSQNEEKSMHAYHPGLGEGGRYHEKATENPLPEGTVLTYALA